VRWLGWRKIRVRRLLEAAASLALMSGAVHAQIATPSNDTIWTVPEVGALPDDDYGRLVRRGRDLITATYAQIGPQVADPAKRSPRLARHVMLPYCHDTAPSQQATSRLCTCCSTMWSPQSHRK